MGIHLGSRRMSLEQTACEDLKAFERRLTEVITCLQPSTTRWRTLLVTISIFTAFGAWQWLVDPETMMVSFLQSLYNHLFFTIVSLASFSLLNGNSQACCCTLNSGIKSSASV